jgi:hypothetical protein
LSFPAPRSGQARSPGRSAEDFPGSKSVHMFAFWRIIYYNSHTSQQYFIIHWYCLSLVGRQCVSILSFPRRRESSISAIDIVTNVGGGNAAHFGFIIPAGSNGVDGAQGPQGEIGSQGRWNEWCDRSTRGTRPTRTGGHE